MACRVCAELERFLGSAREPDSPHLLLGLNESGIRNRKHQHEERILKAELDLKRHTKSCTIAQGILQEQAALEPEAKLHTS